MDSFLGARDHTIYGTILSPLIFIAGGFNDPSTIKLVTLLNFHPKVKCTIGGNSFIIDLLSDQIISGSMIPKKVKQEGMASFILDIMASQGGSRLCLAGPAVYEHLEDLHELFPYSKFIYLPSSFQDNQYIRNFCFIDPGPKYCKIVMSDVEQGTKSRIYRFLELQ